MSLELIIGPMFSGKSSAILQIVNRYKSIGHTIVLISHSIDSRYSELDYIVNHNGQQVPCFKDNTLMKYVDTPACMNSKVIIIEEAQFFNDLYTFVETLVDTYQKDVIVVGLDGDTERKPFGQIMSLVPMCDKIIKLKAFCKICANGNEALFTYCKKEKHEQICVGGEDIYMPLCRIHYLSKISNC
jgi:thymidine kinase